MKIHRELVRNVRQATNSLRPATPLVRAFQPRKRHDTARLRLRELAQSQQRPYICVRCLSTTRHGLQDANATRKPKEDSKPPLRGKQFNAYDLFPATLSAGPPPNGPFDIDLAALRREFLNRQADTHPDRQMDPSLKAKAEGTSATLNENYIKLRDPLQRARMILLMQADIDLENDEAAKEEDSELLMSVLEARETIEEAEKEEDLCTLKDENEKNIEESVGILGTAFANADWDAAKKETIRLRYWMNLRQAIHEWEPGKPVVLVH